MPVKGWNRGADITPETRSQDDQKLSQWHVRRSNQHITGCCSIQYEEMDEAKTTRDTEFNFALDFPETYFGSGKYPTLKNNRKTRINKDQLN